MKLVPRLSSHGALVMECVVQKAPVQLPCFYSFSTNLPAYGGTCSVYKRQRLQQEKQEGHKLFDVYSRQII